MNQFFAGIFYHSTSQACIADFDPPTFGGIQTLSQNTNGSLRATWNAGVELLNPPIRYRAYVQLASEDPNDLFNAVNLQSSTTELFDDVYTLPDNTPLQADTLYRVGYRAVDALGNESQNLNYLECVSLGIPSEAVAELVRLVSRLLSAAHPCLEGEVKGDPALEGTISTDSLEGVIDSIEVIC